MNDDEPFVSDEVQALRTRLKALRLEHADLDASIDALGHMPIPDQLMIARMKRKKLLLRDEITRIEDRILPDIIA
ncbi:YdcH family protein [Brevundimonas sp.]|uniref:YdcH family protein n=1 Tax=Brevundimonas sp. TaxID=1871086 RepID=UPI0035672D8F